MIKHLLQFLPNPAARCQVVSVRLCVRRPATKAWQSGVVKAATMRAKHLETLLVVADSKRAAGCASHHHVGASNRAGPLPATT